MMEKLLLKYALDKHAMCKIKNFNNSNQPQIECVIS